MLQNAKRNSQAVRSARIASRKEKDAMWAAELKAARGNAMSASDWLKANDPKRR